MPFCHQIIIRHCVIKSLLGHKLINTLMDISELESFKLSDAIAFHDKLNPKLFIGQRLRPDVESQLKIIADDFLSELGISGLDVIDITISGSNAAYSYTKHSDLDLHIIVDMSKLPNDEVYRELFNAKKNLYNDSHDIKIHGVPIELYVQDSNEPVKSLGEYSLLNKKWIKIPTKRRANLNQAATRLKYEKLRDLIELALRSYDLSKISEVLRTIKRYRQVGLEKGGEFSPENLAYKVLRTQGLLTRLYAMRDKLHSKRLSIEGMYVSETRWTKPTKKFKKLNEELNHVLHLDIHWNKKIELLEALGKQSIISEVLDDNTVRRVKDLVDSFTAKRLRVGKRYIPVPVTILHNEVMFHDIDKNFPPRVPAKFGTLVDISVDDMIVKFDHDEVIYPISEYRTVAAMTVIFVDTIDKYEKLRTYVSLTFDISLPNFKQITDEDYDPNGPPPGPEFKPTMPKGTVRVDVSDVYDWYKLGQHISNMKGLGKHDFGKGPPSTIMAFGSEPEEHKYIKDLEKTGLTTTDIDPIDPNQPKGMKRQKVDPTYNVNEAFDQPYKLKWEKSEFGDWDALAQLDDGNYLSIMFNKEENDEGEEAWVVEFHRNNSQEVTGEGDAQKVFATVLNAIQTFIKKYKPNKLTFSASKEVEPGQNAQSRAKLYDSLVQRYARAWGYRAFRADTGDKVVYELNRIAKVKEDGTMQYASEKTAAVNPYGGFEDNQYRGSISEDVSPTFVYHVTPTKNLKSIAKQGLVPTVGDRTSQIAGEKFGIYVFPDKISAEDAVMNWLGDEFDDEPLTMLKIDVTGLQDHISKGADYELIVGTTIEPKRIKKVNIQLEEASGYIPSEKEKNDPRFKTALTVDVHPNSIKKNAKAFNSKISRAGIPPTLNPSGKF